MNSVRSASLRGALRSGYIWVKGSRRYKNFDDYLIPEKDFDKLTPALPLSVSADYREYITGRMTLLQSRLEEVNVMAASGELPDVEISDKGIKVSQLNNCAPVQGSPLAELVYSMLPHPKITESLDEVNSWTTFTRHFSHIKNDITRPDNRLLLANIPADFVQITQIVGKTVIIKDVTNTQHIAQHGSGRSVKTSYRTIPFLAN